MSEDLPVPRIDPQDQNDGDLDVGRIEEQPSASEESGDDMEDEIPGDMEFLSNSNQESDDEFPMDGFLIEGQGLRQNVRDPMDLGLFAVDVVDRGPNDDDGSSTASVHSENLERRDEEGEDGEEEGQSPNPTERASFDHELPTRHTYLGATQEVSGRTILEEGETVEIPILYRTSSILMPGQTIPLILFEDNYVSLMKKLIKTTKTFGLVNRRRQYMDNPGERGSLDIAQVGTTAEIYEFGEPSANANEEGRYPEEPIGYTVKARGRQRFRILKTRRTLDGILMGEVKILSEACLSEPMYPVRLTSLDKLRPFADLQEPPVQSSCSQEVFREQRPSTSSATTSGSSTSCTPSLKSAVSGLVQRLDVWSNLRTREERHANKPEYLPRRKSYKLSKHNHLRTCVYQPPLTPLPNWVFEMYDAKCLAEKVHSSLEKIKLFSETTTSVPEDPTELSYWVASHLPFDEQHRMGLLKTDSTVTRLRLEISLMEKFNILCCRHCDKVVGRQSEIFSMSKDGPQGTYVNPGGAVHETLTLYKVQNTRTEGQPQTQFSWFPGYAWEMLICKCNSHLGWRFTTQQRHLQPKKFYGITVRSVKPKFEVDLKESSSEQAEDSFNHLIHVTEPEQ